MKFLGEASLVAWEKAVAACPHATFFHTPAWARILNKTFPRSLTTGQAFSLKGQTFVIPATAHGFEAKGFFRTYASSFLGVYGGPIGPRALSGDEWQNMCEGLSTVRTKRVDIIGNPYSPAEPADSRGWTKKKNFTQIVALENFTTEKELLGRYEHQVRNSINRAARRGYRLKLAQSPDEVLAYHELYKLALVRYADTATGRYPSELFLNALAEGPDKAPLWLALNGERIVGGVLSFVHGSRWVAWNAAFAEDEFPHGVAKWMHHSLILEAKLRGCTTYDFNPSGGHEGTVRFKEMYGAEKHEFWELSRDEGAAFRTFRRLKRVPLDAIEALELDEPEDGIAAPTSATEEDVPEPIPVAHFRTPYLSITETFIYGVLKNLKAPILPVVFTESVLNSELFPYPRLVDYSLKKGSPGRVMNGLTNWVVGNNVAMLGFLFWLNNIRLIHAHFGPQAVELVAIARRLKLPLVTTFYGFDMSSNAKREGWADKYKRLFQVGDVFLIEGPHMREKLLELGCPSEKAQVLRIGVDVAAIPYRERPPKGPNEKVIFLFCGRFIEKKGLIYALQAFEHLLSQGVANFEFRVMGDGPLMPDIKTYLSSHAVGEKTVLLGYRPHADFYRELQDVDVMVAPSVTGADGNSEGGAPTTILEAQAAGVPVVASVHADIPNVVEPGVSALLSPERDVAGLAHNLRYMIEHSEQWAGFGRAGRAFALANHDVAVVVNNLQKIYMRLIAAPARKA